MAGRDGALWLLEGNSCTQAGERFGGCRRWVVLVADLHLRANRRGWLRNRNPVYSLHLKRDGTQRVIFAHNDAILLRINRQDIDRLAGREPKAFALANRVVMYACMAELKAFTWL